MTASFQAAVYRLKVSAGIYIGKPKACRCKFDLSDDLSPDCISTAKYFHCLKSAIISGV